MYNNMDLRYNNRFVQMCVVAMVTYMSGGHVKPYMSKIV